MFIFDVGSTLKHGQVSPSHACFDGEAPKGHLGGMRALVVGWRFTGKESSRMPPHKQHQNHKRKRRIAVACMVVKRKKIAPESHRKGRPWTSKVSGGGSSATNLAFPFLSTQSGLGMLIQWSRLTNGVCCET